MRSTELRTGRTFGVAFDHRDDFMTALADFCRSNGIAQGYIPMFSAGIAEAEIDAPVGSKVRLYDVPLLTFTE